MIKPLTPEQLRTGLFAYSSPDGALDARFNRGTGRVDATGKGFWPPEVAADYFGNWAAMVGAIHDAGKALRAVVDLSKTAIQALDVAGLIGVCGALHGGDDRVALVVPSALMTLQMRRVLDPTCHRFVTSHSAAEVWIAEESRRLRAAA
ncbi:hypothetical protein sphantq_04787 (plasmid) [Sphingobium sp. AntQ-1]|nr:hypothetical protein sphantq_04787 [Sphingobium sp. AntQ-1]